MNLYELLCLLHSHSVHQSRLLHLDGLKCPEALEITFSVVQSLINFALDLLFRYVTKLIDDLLKVLNFYVILDNTDLFCILLSLYLQISIVIIHRAYDLSLVYSLYFAGFFRIISKQLLSKVNRNTVHQAYAIMLHGFNCAELC